MYELVITQKKLLKESMQENKQLVMKSLFGDKI